MSLQTDHLDRCVQTLESALQKLRAAEPGSIDYEIYRNAVIKGFELTLEMAGKLLRRVLKGYAAGPRTVDELTYKDLLRHAGKHGLFGESEVRRWFKYRDNRNSTAHDYGEKFAEETLTLLPDFIGDVRSLRATLKQRCSNAAP